MSLAKTIEVSAASNEGFDAAVKNAYDEVAQTVRNVRSVYAKEFIYEPGHESGAYRVHCKVTFIVESGQNAG